MSLVRLSCLLPRFVVGLSTIRLVEVHCVSAIALLDLAMNSET